MLIRFALENVFSFGERKEFNMIPAKRLKTLLNHKYKYNKFEVLKTSALYGANGAGKSNLIKALSFFQFMVLDGRIPTLIKNTRFKFAKKEKQVLALEFLHKETPFYYAVEITQNRISTEELYISGLGEKEDILLFERKTNADGKTEIIFANEFDKNPQTQMLKKILIEEFIKPETLAFKLLANRENNLFNDIKIAFDWFLSALTIITPTTKPRTLTNLIDKNQEFKDFAEKLVQSFSLGISSLSCEKRELAALNTEESQIAKRFIAEIEKKPDKQINLIDDRGVELLAIKEEDKFWFKKLKVGHGKDISFDIEDESDGTIRLFDFIPAFRALLTENSVFVIDEIERSIHPSLIKELLKKFSDDNNTKGQLIFTTHESNLLDQSLFRQDEIWFVEKGQNNCSDLYSLSDFKEHKTIDIRKGYLTGRYGAIPFLSNLKDLNWHKNDFNKSAVQSGDPQ